MLAVLVLVVLALLVLLALALAAVLAVFDFYLQNLTYTLFMRILI